MDEALALAAEERLVAAVARAAEGAAAEAQVAFRSSLHSGLLGELERSVSEGDLLRSELAEVRGACGQRVAELEGELERLLGELRRRTGQACEQAAKEEEPDAAADEYFNDVVEAAAEAALEVAAAGGAADLTLDGSQSGCDAASAWSDVTEAAQGHPQSARSDVCGISPVLDGSDDGLHLSLGTPESQDVDLQGSASGSEVNAAEQVAEGSSRSQCSDVDDVFAENGSAGSSEEMAQVSPKQRPADAVSRWNVSDRGAIAVEEPLQGMPSSSHFVAASSTLTMESSPVELSTHADAVPSADALEAISVSSEPDTEDAESIFLTAGQKGREQHGGSDSCSFGYEASEEEVSPLDRDAVNVTGNEATVEDTVLAGGSLLTGAAQLDALRDMQHAEVRPDLRGSYSPSTLPASPMDRHGAGSTTPRAQAQAIVPESLLPRTLSQTTPLAPDDAACTSGAARSLESSAEPFGEPAMSKPSLKAEASSEGVLPVPPLAPAAADLQRVCWWQACLPKGTGLDTVSWKSWQIQSGPGANTKVVGYMQVGKVFLAKSSSSFWLEIIMDGGPPGYIPKGSPIWDTGEPEQQYQFADRVLKVVDSPTQSLTSHGPLYDMAWTIPATRVTQSLINGVRPRGVSWWKVVVEKGVFVRPARNRNTAPSGMLHQGKVVLARQQFAEAAWLELIDPLERGHPGLYLLCKDDEPGMGLRALMEPVTDVADVLGLPDSIKTPWSVDVSMPLGDGKLDALASAVARRLAEKALHLNQRPEPAVRLEIQEITGLSQQHRTFEVNRAVEGSRDKYILRCSRIAPADLSVPGRLPHFLCSARFAAASHVFSRSGLAPYREASGPGWHLETYAGSNISTQQYSIEKLALLMAEIHKMPTDWFVDWREALRTCLPWLSDVPDGSHAWFYTCNPDMFVGLAQDKLVEWAWSRRYAPRSKAGRAVVTCHGDFHLHNIVITEAGKFQTIDLEHSHVTHAIQDIAYAVRMCCSRSLEDRQLFVKHYLKAMNVYSEGGQEKEQRLLLADCNRQWHAEADMRALQRPDDHAPTPAGAGLSSQPIGVHATREQQTAMVLPERPSVSDKQQGIMVKQRWPVPSELALRVTDRVSWKTESNGAGWWKVVSCAAAGVSLPLEALTLFCAPSLSAAVVSVLPLGSIVLGTDVADSPGYLEVLLDGVATCFMRRSKNIRMEPVTHETRPGVAVCCAAMHPLGLAAIRRLEPGVRGGLALKPAGIQQEAQYFQVLIPRIRIRTEPSPLSTCVEILLKGQIVLAKPHRLHHHWLELVLPGNRKYFMCHWMQENEPPQLMEPVKRPMDVLGEHALVFNHHFLPFELLLGDDERESAEQTLVASLAAEAISGIPNHATADPSLIHVSELASGEKSRKHRTSKTFLVTCPPSRSKSHAASKRQSLDQEDEYFVLRHDRAFSAQVIHSVRLHPLVAKKCRADASRLFSEFGLAPQRLNEGAGWYLEEYGGPHVQKSRVGLLLCAQLLARIHMLPTEWFDQWRARIRGDLPWTDGVAAGSYVWRFACKTSTKPSLKFLQWWKSLPSLMPVSKVASRVVTCHGDFRRSNIVVNSSGRLQCVGMGQACVACAAVDLAFAIHSLCTWGDYDERQEFARAYILETCGEASDKEVDDKEVDDLILDAQCLRFAEKLYANPDDDSVYEAIQYVRRSRTDKLADELREKLIKETLTAAGDHWRARRKPADASPEPRGGGRPAPPERGRRP